MSEIFEREKDFEDALIKLLSEHYGWKAGVLEYKTEEDLRRNWAEILFQNNRQRDRLNDYPLTDGEMRQIQENINKLQTPLKLNAFINGRTVSIVRDNPDDKEHFGKTVHLKIYDRKEIAGGDSRYQIARQPKFKAKSSIIPDRRGDFILLINGMPVIHVELKKSNVPVSQAINQIDLYSHEHVFTGLFSLVQVFVAMTPEETVYFANPGPGRKSNSFYRFHWADFDNQPINDWRAIASKLLSIPMAHQLIGFYTVADNSDGVLKVLRSYQYQAADQISNVVRKHDWEGGSQLGGFVWHTTGSGKTLTSFKAASLIENSDDADKVIFLVDRIELGNQSANVYKSIADDASDVQKTRNTGELVGKLKSDNPSDKLIVTSIQKLSNIDSDSDFKMNQADYDAITSKRIVFIVDECHRSTFGEMMQVIKKNFSKALFFGFSGTPIHIDNQKKGNTTSDVFGNELHRYSIADGIRDGNVLGFDTDKILTFKEKDERIQVALENAKASSVEEAQSDPKKKKIFDKFMNDVPMVSTKNAKGKKIKGIEEYLIDCGQYRTEEHQKAVVENILENWAITSHANKFHGIFATSSIHEACQYYRLFKKMYSKFKVTALFDPNIDNNEGATDKEDCLVSIIDDYNEEYGQTFNMATWAEMKEDIQDRLAHKWAYCRIGQNNTENKKRIDLLIVVDQMLTGYDSKWVNVLYLDKILYYESIIQAFSRTNRLNDNEKRFGMIKYYRAPFTMEQNIKEAVKLYSGERPFDIFVCKLDKNLDRINYYYNEIRLVFAGAGINNFEKLPSTKEERNKFVKLFNELNSVIDSAKVQGFLWDKVDYIFPDGENSKTIHVELDKHTYNALLQRYKELFGGEKSDPGDTDAPYDLQRYITEIDSVTIDKDYIEAKFVKFIKIKDCGDAEQREKVKSELHQSFASLPQEQQEIAKSILSDMEAGILVIEEGKTFNDYINLYSKSEKDNQIYAFVNLFGVNEDLLRKMLSQRLDNGNINQFGMFDELRDSIDYEKAQLYFEKTENKKLSKAMVKIHVGSLLRDFILNDDFKIKLSSPE